MSKKLTDEELFAQFEGIDAETAPPKASFKPSTTSTANQPPANPDDLFQELGIPERPKPTTSRPQTPKFPSTSTTPALRSSPKRNSTATPPSSDAARSSEERAPPRKSAESTRSFHNSFTPKTENEEQAEQEPGKSAAPTPAQAQSSGGGWWGGIVGAASAAVKQAEALAKEIQKNEEAQRWAEQVKGNVGALRGFGKYAPSRPPATLFLFPLVDSNTDGMQEANYAPELSQHSPPSCTPSPLPSQAMNASKSTSPMISTVTPPSPP